MMPEKEKMPLLIRAPNWVGEVILALPAFDALSSAGFDLHIFIHPSLMELLAGTSYKLYPLPRDIKVWQGSRIIKKLPYKYMLIFPRSFTSVQMAFLAGKKTIGYAYETRWILLSKIVPRNKNLHILPFYWELARFTTQYLIPHANWPNEIPKKINLPVSPIHLDKAKRILQDLGINRPFWVLCPMAVGKDKIGDKFILKIWPHWNEFSQALGKKEHLVVACPGPGEEKECRDLLPNAIIIPNLNLGEYLAVMSLAKQIISNDTGPMHMAAALNSPMLGIFGVTEFKRWHPWGGKTIGDQSGWPSLKDVLLACGEKNV